MHFSPLAFLPLFALALPATAHGSANARFHRGLVGRAGAAISNDTLNQISSSIEYADNRRPTPTTSFELATSTPVQSETTDVASSAVQSEEQAPISSALAQPSVVPVSSVEEEPETSSAAPVPSEAASPSPTPVGPSTISSPVEVVSTVVRGSASRVSIVTTTRTASSSSSASASADAASSNQSTKIAGLPQTTFIIIVVVAAVVALIGIGWTLFRKWKLRPSNRFDERMKPIDFSPHNDGMNDVFLEKTLHRSHSNSSVDRQRQQLVAELDEPNPNHVAGIPEHDFTAVNQAGYGAYNADVYNNDPFAHAQQYDYEQEYYNQHAYPPATHAQAHGQGYDQHEHPTQDSEEGYANLQRGNSTGSGGHSGHGHGQQQVYPTDFPSPEAYLGRPTQGQDGPYAQAQYRY